MAHQIHLSEYPDDDTKRQIMLAGAAMFEITNAAGPRNIPSILIGHILTVCGAQDDPVAFLAFILEEVAINFEAMMATRAAFLQGQLHDAPTRRQ